MCVCLCVTETTWDSMLCLLEKVNTVKVSVCKEWKVVCADTQTIADAVWTSCSYIVIPMLQRAEMHSHKHATQIKRCEMNRIVDWSLAFDQSPLYRLQPETRQRCNGTFHAGLLMQGKGTFSTLSDIPNRSKERLLPSELSETHWQASALGVMMFNASGQSPPSETRGAISSCLSPRGRYFRCIDSSDDQSLGLSSAVPGGCWRRHLAPLFV